MIDMFYGTSGISRLPLFFRFTIDIASLMTTDFSSTFWPFFLTLLTFTPGDLPDASPRDDAIILFATNI